MHAKSIQSNNVISGSLTERLKRTKSFERGRTETCNTPIAG